MNIAVENSELPHIGEVIDGRYRIEAIHALGGMGTVFRATHLLLARAVALKFVSSSVVRLPGVAGRFLREARTATQLENDHIVKVFDVGVWGNGTPYLVMEWLEGSDLSQLMDANGALPVETAVDYVLQACEALAEVHGRGVIHRDLKPANLFAVRGPDGVARIKLLDFGVSKISVPGTGGVRITLSGSVLGSPSYMSPEQMGDAESADERTDIWGLGVVLFELLTKKLPFGAGALADILGAILLSPTPHASDLSARIPRELDRVIEKCLSPEAADRYPDVTSLALALVPFGPPNAAQRAQATAEATRAARLRPVGGEVAAHDEDLIDHVQSGPSTSARNAMAVEKIPRPPGNTHRRATYLAATVFAIAVGIPAGVAHLALTARLSQASAPIPMAVTTLSSATLGARTIASARVTPVASIVAGVDPAVLPIAPEPVVIVPRVSHAPFAVSAPRPHATTHHVHAATLPPSEARVSPSVATTDDLFHERK